MKKHWWFIIIGSVLYFFATGRFSVDIAVWLAPMLLLLGLNGFSKRVAYLIISSLVILLFPIQWSGYIPAPMPLFLYICFGNAVILLLPYCLHLWLYKKEKKYTIAVFPISCVLIEYMFAIFSPYGTWGAMIYAQLNNVFINQIVSLCGIYGISFSIGLLATTTLLISDYWKRLREIKRVLMISAAWFALVIIYSGIKYFEPMDNNNQVQISGITIPITDKPFYVDSLVSTGDNMLRSISNVYYDLYVFNKAIATDQEEEVEQWMLNLQRKLLNKTKECAEKGSKIIIWSEGNGLVLKESEKDFIDQCKALAKNYRITLFASLNTKTIGERYSENKIVAINSAGEVVYEYLKSHPVVGAEYSVEGLGQLKTIDTEYGKLTSVICFDADFNNLVRQASVLQSSLIVVTGYDWSDINPKHTQMASVRAIENGTPLVRQANYGYSASYNSKGIEVASKEYEYDPLGYDFTSNLCLETSLSLYSQIGDVFVYILLLAAMLILFERFTNR